MAKKKSASVSVETKRSVRNLKTKLNDSEMLQYGRDLSDQQIKLNQIEAEKKEMNDRFKSHATECEGKIGQLSQAISTGYEYRNVDCTEYFDRPATGKKTIVRDDLDEDVAVEDMTLSELQRTMAGIVEDEPAVEPEAE